jgi:amino-acid N-acetyltransferase
MADEQTFTLRRARPDDVPRMIALIAGADLPPLFVEEFLGGFVAVEQDGEVAGCGGLEVYEDCGVIRSVVVDESARGFGLGRRLAEMLMDDARARGITDIYLFTADAWDFWWRLGFEDVTYEDWNEPARACWQYQFLSQNRHLMPDIHTMWRKA